MSADSFRAEPCTQESRRVSRIKNQQGLQTADALGRDPYDGWVPSKGKSMNTLYSAPRPECRKGSIGLEELELPYEVRRDA